MGDAGGPPRVALPTASERRMRFGPFPSLGDAMRFVGYAAAGALVIPWWGALAWLPIPAMAFVLVVWQPGGSSLDARIFAYFAWRERAQTPSEGGVSARSRRAHAGVARIDPGMAVSVLKCEGRPIAFLPPNDLFQKFRQYRELLRSLDGGFALVGVGIPVDARPWLPKDPSSPRADELARAGYREMVGILCRQRRRRRVYVLQWAVEGIPGSIARLEERTRNLAERLEELGVSPVRLEGATLGASLPRFGWSAIGEAEAP